MPLSHSLKRNGFIKECSTKPSTKLKNSPLMSGQVECDHYTKKNLLRRGNFGGAVKRDAQTIDMLRTAAEGWMDEGLFCDAS